MFPNDAVSIHGRHHRGSWHDSPITSNLGLPWKRVRCAMSTWREAVLEGVKEAARLHEQLALRTQIEATPGSIDVFSVIVQLNIPPLFRLLGTFLPKPSPGIIVTTERNLAIQRFTGAHELGHCYIGHEVSLDDKPILKRSPFGSRSYDPREAAADGDRKDNPKNKACALYALQPHAPANW